MCLTILAVTVYEKFSEGGWITLAVTGAVVLLCFLVRRHYQTVNVKLVSLYANLANLPRPSSKICPFCARVALRYRPRCVRMYSRRDSVLITASIWSPLAPSLFGSCNSEATSFSPCPPFFSKYVSPLPLPGSFLYEAIRTATPMKMPCGTRAGRSGCG